MDESDSDNPKDSDPAEEDPGSWGVDEPESDSADGDDDWDGDVDSETTDSGDDWDSGVDSDTTDTGNDWGTETAETETTDTGNDWGTETTETETADTGNDWGTETAETETADTGNDWGTETAETETADTGNDWGTETADSTTTDTGGERRTETNTATDTGNDWGEATTQQSPVDEQPAAGAAGQRTTQAKGVDEEFCTSCGATIKKNAEICPECGVRTGNTGASGPNEKDPGVAAIASFFIPGVGQLYNGQMGRGAAIIVGYMVFWVVTVVAIFFIIGILMMFAAPLFHIFAAWDAYSQAEKINKGEVVV